MQSQATPMVFKSYTIVSARACSCVSCTSLAYIMCVLRSSYQHPMSINSTRADQRVCSDYKALTDEAINGEFII